MVRTLEVPESVADCQPTGNETEDLPEMKDESQVENTENSETAGNDDENAVEVDPAIQPPELTADEKIEAYIRKEQVLREAQSEKTALKILLPRFAGKSTVIKNRLPKQLQKLIGLLLAT